MRQNKDYSPGDSLSDSSEKLFGRDEEEAYIYMVWVKGEYVQSNTHFCRRFLLVLWRLLLITRNRYLY